jgi:ABC-2 type transport system ATP-binding protein
MIRIINLRNHYGRLAALDNLNIEVAPGEILGFLGPNGAGKTTSRVMMGILRASSGRVILGGHDRTRAAASQSDCRIHPRLPVYL